MQEEKQAQDFIKQHLFDEFGFDDVVFEGAIVKCPSHSKFGIFKASLRGRNADKVVSRLKQRGLSDLTLENGLILRLKICLNECSIPDPNTPNSMISGAIVAALFICVVVAGIILLMVILVRYRR